MGENAFWVRYNIIKNFVYIIYHIIRNFVYIIYSFIGNFMHIKWTLSHIQKLYHIIRNVEYIIYHSIGNCAHYLSHYWKLCALLLVALLENLCYKKAFLSIFIFTNRNYLSQIISKTHKLVWILRMAKILC